MKLRTFAAAATAALIGAASSLMIPVANAATVTVNGNVCTMVYTPQDIVDMREAVANSDTETRERLKAAFPSLGDGLDLLLNEVETQIINTGDINIYRLSAEAFDVYRDYTLLGAAAGFSGDDLGAMLVASVLPAMMSVQANSFGADLIGTQYTTKSKAQEMLNGIESIRFGAAIDFTNGTYIGTKLSPKALEIVSPSENVINTVIDTMSEPFQQCVDAEEAPVVEDTPPIIDEDETDDTPAPAPTPQPGGNNNNGGGGSSFGSS